MLLYRNTLNNKVYVGLLRQYTAKHSNCKLNSIRPWKILVLTISYMRGSRGGGAKKAPIYIFVNVEIRVGFKIFCEH